MDGKTDFQEIFSLSESIVLDKGNTIKLAILCVLCGGNLLIEDRPGVGKTTLVYLISKMLGRKLTRIQFTNDLLPADIIGAIVYDKKNDQFFFRKGPIFSEMILADELNRATPKTQSALLQSMEEKRVSVEGKDYSLDKNFCIVATQNPYDHIGTFNLPESQVDRFFMGMSLGLPSREYEKKIMQIKDSKKLIDSINTVLAQEKQRAFLEKLEHISTTGPLLNYALNLMDYLRKTDQTTGYISPRAGRDLLWASKGHAILEGRDFVIPEDIKAVAPFVFAHRLGLYKGIKHGLPLVNKALLEVAVP